MPAQLTGQQREAFEQFSRLKVGALFMKQGTGKTRTALELVRHNRDRVDMLLWLAPHSAVEESIEPEIAKWGSPVPHLVVGYESIASSDRIYADVLRAVEGKRLFIVADESAFIKNGRAKRSERAEHLRQSAEYALVLNGTPVVRDEWDLYHQMHFLSPLIIGMSPNEFRSKFFTRHERKRAYEHPRIWHTFSQVNADVLTQMISPYVFSCDLEFEHAENTGYTYVPYCGEEYYNLKEELLDTDKDDFMEVCKYLSLMNKASATYEPKNKRLAEKASGRRCIVFCGYLDEVRQIASACDCHVIVGSTAGRSDILARWRVDDKPLVMTYGVGAYSLNLQDCSEVIYSSLTFNYGHYDQSQHRIKRMGQESDITYRYILSDVPLQKMISDCLGRKERLSDIVKQKIADGEVGQWLSAT